MGNLFNDKYRIDSIRLPGWDYGSVDRYFVTICTKNRECFFGNIVNGKMQLSEIGEIVKTEWIKTKQLRKNIELDEFTIMPDHFHGILVINVISVETPRNSCKGVARNAFTKNHMSRISPKSRTLSTIIRSFKSAITRQCRQMSFHNFAWQSRFYEHIIRNKFELNRIREYIMNNPLKWHLDCNK